MKPKAIKRRNIIPVIDTIPFCGPRRVAQNPRNAAGSAYRYLRNNALITKSTGLPVGV
jgi:hypothetical protein